MDIEIHGRVEPGFEKVKEAFKANWEGYELGASFSVVHQGRTVVDIWGGYLDTEFTKPWQADTLVKDSSQHFLLSAASVEITRAHARARVPQCQFAVHVHNTWSYGEQRPIILNLIGFGWVNDVPVCESTNQRDVDPSQGVDDLAEAVEFHHRDMIDVYTQVVSVRLVDRRC